MKLNHKFSTSLSPVIVGTAITALIISTISFTLKHNSAESAPSNKKLEASISIDANTVIKTIPTGLLGTNIEWFHNANYIWDVKQNKIDPQTIKLARELGISLVRFPGGCLSDYYHWRSGIGPLSKRPMAEHVMDKDKSVNQLGTDELMQFCQDTNSKPLITVNIITGTPEEAAEWVAYCNSKNNSERLKNGHKEAYGVKYWEIGNEQYLYEGSKDTARSLISPKEYVKRYLAFHKAMKHVDPSISIIGIGAQNFGRYTTCREPNWNKVVIPALAPYMDYFALHNAYFPICLNLGWFTSTEDVYQALLAAPKLIEDNLNTISKQFLDWAPKDAHRIKFAITEWGPLFQIDAKDKWLDHPKTLGSALFVGSAMQTFIKSPHVDIANFFKLKGDFLLGIINSENIPKPSYYAMQMYSKYFGQLLIPTKTICPTYDSKDVGWVAAVKDVPYLDAIASLSKDHNRLYLIVVNKNFDQSIKTRINILGFNPGPQITTRILTAPSIDANNGRDLPVFPGHKWPDQAKASRNSMFDSGKPDTVVTKEFKTGIVFSQDLNLSSNQNSSFAYSFPPLSISAIELHKTQ